MKLKYNYFVSYVFYNGKNFTFSSAVLSVDKKLHSIECIDKLKNDIKKETGIPSISIIGLTLL